VTGVAAALLVEGILRADLAGLFWGASFVVLPVYAVAAGHLLRFRLRRRSRSGKDSLSLELPGDGLDRGKPAEARLSIRLPRSFPPGFSVRALLPLRWQQRRLTGVEAALSTGENHRLIPFTAAHRGAFQSDGIRLQVSDLLQLTRADVLVARHSTVTVFPGVTAAQRARRTAEESEEAAPRARSRRRTEELLEARKYYPGDDPRRINWKVYAHMGELFLRIGEETPPPESRVLFVLDASANPLVPDSVAADYLDSLVDAYSSAVVDLLAQDVDLLAMVPGVLKCASFTRESQATLLGALAGVWWASSSGPFELPSRRGLHVAVYSSPGSPGLSRIIEAARARGYTTSLFLKGLPPEPPARRFSLSRLLLVPSAPRRDPPADGATRGQREALVRALTADLTSYQGPPWMVRYAAEV